LTPIQRTSSYLALFLPRSRLPPRSTLFPYTTLFRSSNPFHPGSEGTYYAQARKTGTTCAPGPRTAVSYKVYQAPSVRDETLYLCSGSSVILDSGVENMNYHWSTGATSRTISVSDTGVYSVNINTSKGCSSTKTIE